jgi:uncharacterized membrane protein HdeD (DUF308 family)
MGTTAFPLLESMSRHWWLLAMKGVIAVLFAIVTFVLPGVTLAVLVLAYGAFALADGVLAVVAGVQGRWWGLFLAGVLGIAVGAITLLWPGITALALLYLIAGWAIVTGVMQMAAAAQLRGELANEWLLGLIGVASVIFGVLLVVNPGSGALSVLWLIAAFALAYGLLLLTLAIRIRALFTRLDGRVAR